MGASKVEEKKIARQWYLSTDKTMEEISEIVKVAPQTLGKWAKEGNWETLKTAQKITKAEIIQEKYKCIKELHDDINRREKKIPTISEINILSQLHNQLDKLEKKESLSQYIHVFEKFTKFLSTNAPQLVKEVSSLSYKFLEQIAAGDSDED